MPTDNGKSKETLIPALCYVWILWALPLLTKDKDEFTKFHMRQGLALFLVSLVSWFFPPLWFLYIIVVVIAFIKAYQGEKWEIPLIIEIAKRLKI